MTETSLPKGREAIVSPKETLWAQIESFVLGFAGSAALGLLAAALVSLLLNEPVVALGTGVIVLLATFLSGIYSIPPAQNGVPLFFGSYIDWWLLPSGYSWWLPRYLGGGLGMRVPVGERDLPLEFGKMEAADNVQLPAIKLTAVIRIRYPYVWARFSSSSGNPVNAVRATLERATRFLITHVKSVEIPSLSGSSVFLTGQEDTVDIVVETTDGEGEIVQKRRRGGPFSNGNPNETIKAIMASYGFSVERVNLEDPNLPPEIVAAAAEKRIEEMQQKSELTEAETVNLIAQKLREQFPELSEEQIMQAIQTMQGKAQRKIVDINGSAAVPFVPVDGEQQRFAP